MSYATQDDLVSRFGETEIIQLSDRANTGVIDSGVVADKLADADAEIEAYLGARYALPLAVVPTVLVRVASDIARYHLYANRATDDVVRRYKDAIAFLAGVAAGKISIGIDTTAGTTPAASDVPQVATVPQVFDAGTILDFRRS